MAEQRCNGMAVAVIARDYAFRNKILLMKNGDFSSDFTPILGHIGEMSCETAVHRVFRRLTGLYIFGVPQLLKLELDIRLSRCSSGCQSHYWQVYSAICEGRYSWTNDNFQRIEVEQIYRLAEKTHEYGKRLKLASKAEQKRIQKERRENPGLDPLWENILRELRII